MGALITRRNDLAIALNGHCPIYVGACGDEGELAIATKAGVEAAVGIKTHHHAIVVATHRAVTHGHNLAIGLQSHIEQKVVGAKTGAGLAAGAETRIERPVFGVADQTKTEHARDTVCVTANDDHAVGLNQQTVSCVLSANKVGDDTSAGAETGVERAIGVVAREGEVSVSTVEGPTGNNDFAIGLHGSRRGTVITRTQAVMGNATEGGKGRRFADTVYGDLNLHRRGGDGNAIPGFDGEGIDVAIGVFDRRPLQGVAGTDQRAAEGDRRTGQGERAGAAGNRFDAERQGAAFDVSGIAGG